MYSTPASVHVSSVFVDGHRGYSIEEAYTQNGNPPAYSSPTGYPGFSSPSGFNAPQWQAPNSSVYNIANPRQPSFNGGRQVHVGNLQHNGSQQKNDKPGIAYDPYGYGRLRNSGTNSSSQSSSDMDADHSRRLERKFIKDQAERDRDPIWIVKLITSHPKKALAITVFGHIFFMLLNGILFLAGYDIMPMVFNSFPLDLTDDVDFLRAEAWDWRNENDDIVERGESDEALTPRSKLLDTVSMLYFKEGRNVLTKSNLQAIQNVENQLLNDRDFQNKFCRLTKENACVKPQSLIRFFDGTFEHISPVFNDPNFDNIAGVINEANSNSETKQTLQLLIAKSSVLEPTQVSSWITGSFISIGQPLEGYSYTVECLSCDRNDDQLLKAESLMLDVVSPIGDKYFDQGVGDLDFTYGSQVYFNGYVFGQVIFDMLLAIGSFTAIGLFICLQTWSLFIGGMVVFGIFMSFLEANIIYRCILNYRYIGVFHVLSVFIILGIGADDVFIFVDTWKETEQHKYKSLAHRLSDCYRRSAISMLFTSVTTAAAFIVAASAPFLLISAFGVFSGLLITVNYISVITYVPSLVIFHHLYLKKYKCCCCCPEEEQPMEHVEAQKKEEPPHKERLRNNFMVKFFHGPYYRFITHKVFRWFILLGYAGVLALFCWFTSNVVVEEEQVEYFPSRINLGKWLKLTNRREFAASDGIRQIYVVFGLKNQDRSDCHRSEALCQGDTVWDEKFNMDSPRVQESFASFCNAIRNLPDEDIDYLEIRRNPITGIPEVNCFVEPMTTFYEAEENRALNGVRKFPGGTNFSFPVQGPMVETIMQYTPEVYNLSTRNNPNWDSDFETSISYWMYQGFARNTAGQYSTGPDFKRYDPLTGETRNTDTVVEVRGNGITYYYGTRLRYAAVTINTTIEDANLAYITGLPLRDRWEEVISNEISKLEPELQGGFQTTPRGNSFAVWHWIKIQKKLVRNAIIGIIIGLSIAFPVLIAATNNFITGLIATFTLVCITVMVTGFIDAVGWRLGFMESVNLVLVVGLAVDYCVHLAQGYSRSTHPDRKNRTRDSLTEVGISVTSGALTSCTAVCFLLGAEITFFRRFGLFIVSTLAFSLIWAIGFFPTLCAMIGPQNDFGKVSVLFKWILGKCGWRCQRIH